MTISPDALRDLHAFQEEEAAMGQFLLILAVVSGLSLLAYVSLTWLEWWRNKT